MPYVKYLNDLKISDDKTYNFFNFWPGINSDTFRLVKFLKENNLNPQGKKTDFFSVFGPRKLINYSNNIKIFFSGEHIGEDRYPDYQDLLLDYVDLSLGYDEVYRNNYFRFPLYLLYLINPQKTSHSEIKNQLKEIESKKNVNQFFKRKFCALIAFHDRNGVRTKTFNVLKQIDEIDCPGKLLHNCDENIPLNEDKIKFLKNYKFNICPENIYLKNRDQYSGYVTEKFIDSWFGGALPIYDGIFSDFEKEIFNEERIIFIDDNIFSTVNNLVQDEKLLEEFYMQDIFNKNASDLIFEKIEQLKNKFILIYK